MKIRTQTVTASLALSCIMMLTSFAVSAKEIKQTYNGLSVNGNLIMADGKTLKDDVVLLTHGTLTRNDRETYTIIQDLLAENGISSLAINLSLGLNDRHGEYDCATPHTHKHTDAPKEIGFWLDWLKSQGASNVTLMGHSRGGNQTAWFGAENDNPMVGKLILIAPQTWNQAYMAKDYKKRYGTDLQSLLTKAEKLVKAGKGNTMMKNIGFIYCENTQATAEAFVDYYQDNSNMDTPTLLEKVKKPTLVIIGSADKVVADLPAKMEKVKNGQVQSYTVEDSDHFFLDLFGEELVEASVEFIKN